mgnify:CR=1 FL=1
MQLTTKVLYATLVILALMFVHSAKVSQDAERAGVVAELKAQQQPKFLGIQSMMPEL